MIDFDENFNIIYDREAAKQKVKYRCKIFNGEVPFNYPFGIPNYVFKYGGELMVVQVKSVLSSVGIVSDVYYKNGRVTVISLNITL